MLHPPRTALAIALALAALLALPVAAGAQTSCYCQAFAKAFTNSPPAQAELDYQLGVYYNIGSVKRGRIKRAIYDYAQQGDFKTSFCQLSEAHRKACKAARACVIAAAGSYIASRTAGASKSDAAKAAVPACVTGVLTVYFVA